MLLFDSLVRQLDAYKDLRNLEMSLMNMLITEEALKNDAFRRGERDKNQFIQNNRLNMERVLEKFVEYYGRKFFLLYLKPIINGTGNFYLEAQTRDTGWTDVIMEAVV